MAKSILQNDKACLLTGATWNLHKHHIFGGSNRKNSERTGLWCYLRAELHNGSNEGVHFNHELDLKLKVMAQKEFEKKHSRDEFMNIFGRNYV